MDFLYIQKVSIYSCSKIYDRVSFRKLNCNIVLIHHIIIQVKFIDLRNWFFYIDLTLLLLIFACRMQTLYIPCIICILLQLHAYIRVPQIIYKTCKSSQSTQSNTFEIVIQIVSSKPFISFQVYQDQATFPGNSSFNDPEK